MKKFKLFNWMLVALMAFQFASCSDEPLEGQFPQAGGGPGEGEVGAFTAKINGVNFVAASTSAVVFSDGFFTITGVSGSNNAITISVPNIATGNFSLTDIPDTNNTAAYVDAAQVTNPYTTLSGIGGSGQMVITSYNEIDMLISGSFQFTGARQAQDAQGTPLFDGNGDPIIQQVQITEGLFTAIPYILDEDGGGGGGNGGGGDPNGPVEDFFALADGEEFVDTTLTTTSNMVGEVLVIKIEALTATGQLIRLDIPSDIGIGTFPMESEISDGSMLIGLYNGNTGGENLSSNPGEMTITTFNTTDGILEGTFFFTARDPLMQDPTVVEITEGTFTVFTTDISIPEPLPFRAVVDGLEFLPAVNDIIVTNNEVNMIESRTITATIPSGREITITLPVNVEVGVYEMAPEVVNGDEVVGTYTLPNVNTVFSSNPGTLTVQEYDSETGEIRATFSFTAIDNVGTNPSIASITEGEFALNIL